MDLKKYYIEWKKPGTKEYIIYDSIYNSFKNMKN